MNDPLRVVVVGHGVIGSRVASGLAAGEVAGAELVAVVNRSRVSDPPAEQRELDEVLDQCDLVVECAGQPVVHEIIDRVTSSGADLLVTSVGALLDERLGERLEELGPGRVVATHGALGGLDMIDSARRAGPFTSARLRSVKKPVALVRDWMSPTRAEEIRSCSDRIQVFSGSPAEAVRLFPDSLNVVAALATAVGDRELVTVELYADPAAQLTSHRVQAVGPLGEYDFEVRHQPSAERPRSSAITPFSVLSSIALLTSRPPKIL